MKFNPGIDILPTAIPFGFSYGSDVFGPEVEIRTLDAIRKSLLDPSCKGPQEVYSIAMDVGKKPHINTLIEMHLLFGVVTYAAGKLGREPIRSQGHVHKRSSYAGGWSTPEVYEIWSGKAIIYLQEFAADYPGRCYAIYANPGDVVIVPPSWAHATISADPNEILTFGAWCDRDYGFEYQDVRTHNGLAFYPLIDGKDKIRWLKNDAYHDQELIRKKPRAYKEFGITVGLPIYSQFEQNPEKFLFVPRPDLFPMKWEGFVP